MAIKVSLTVIDGPDKGLTYDFVEGFVTVGRRNGEIILNDKKVSSAHCVFSIEGDQLFIEDRQSTNGTFLSGRKLEGREELSNLDQVVVGLSRISVAIIETLDRPRKHDADSRPPLSKSEKAIARPPLESFLEEPSSSISGIDDADILSNVEFSSKRPAPAAPSAAAESASKKKWADDLAQDFGEAPTEAEPTVSASSAAKAESREPTKTHQLPPEDAEYRHTGIQRIESLISDEMQTMSKWDDPELKEKSEVLAIPRIRVQLKITKGPDGHLEFFCNQAVTTIGRKDVDIRLNDLDCSRKHSQIEIVGGKQVFVKDLASTNGTYVNGKKVTQQEVFSGDVIQVGQTLFEVNIQSGS